MLSPRISSSAGRTSIQPSMRRFVAKLGPEGTTAVRVAVSAISIARSFGLRAQPGRRVILGNEESRLRTHVVLGGARFFAAAQNDTVGTLSEFASRESKGDRKSTRLNSSHANISYAVFCLKKTNTNP